MRVHITLDGGHLPGCVFISHLMEAIAWTDCARRLLRMLAARRGATMQPSVTASSCRHALSLSLSPLLEQILPFSPLPFRAKPRNQAIQTMR